MKKTKLLKCLLPLLGVSALTIVPILSTACANGVINNQAQSVNETLVDETSSSASGSSTQTGSTSTSIVDEYYKNKKTENLNILKNIKWFYKNPNSKPDILDDKHQIDLDLSPSNLDWAISGVYDLNSGNNIITDMQNGSATLGFYPYVKLGKNQYTPFNPVTTTTDSDSTTTTTSTIKNQWFLPNENLMLKGKILTMDYFIPEVTIYKEQTPTSTVDSSIPTNKLDNYKLAINKLTLSDSTTEFPNGDPRTIATLEVPKTNTKSNKVNWDGVKTNTPSLQILDIKRPNPKAIIDVLDEYQKVVTDNADKGIKTVREYLAQVKADDGSKYSNQFASILNKFNDFATINLNNVTALKEYLAFEDAHIFSVVIDHILDKLFNLDSGTNNLFKTFDDILKSLDAVKDQKTLYLLAESTTGETATQVAGNIKSLVKTMATYYLSFAHTLYDLVSSCVKPNWLLPPSLIQAQK